MESPVANNNGSRDPWTPEDRNTFIDRAVNSKDAKGNWRGFYFNVLPKLDGQSADANDGLRSKLTDTLARVIYETPAFKSISLRFFVELQHKIMAHPKLNFHMGRDIVVMIKGGNSYNFLVPKMMKEFPMSDLDIAVYINPFLEKHVFEAIKADVEIIVRQTMSQYKRSIDAMFFINNTNNTNSLPLEDAIIADFKEALNEAITQINDDEGGEFISPFLSNEIRNTCSRHSFLITNSNFHENHVVKVDLPHFDKCERIPLRRTPLFCSFNESIDFDRDEAATKRGTFNLYRLRLNFMHVTVTSDADSNHPDDDKNAIKTERIAADFIDVTVPNQQDAELINFWNYGRATMLYDVDTGYWLVLPDLRTSIAELDRILTEYECPAQKREKRERKLAALKKALADYGSA